MAGTGRLKPAAQRLFEAARDNVPEGRIVVALSGGADSAVAAWLAVKAAGSDCVAAVHVHHDQAASDRLEDAAVTIAEMLGLDIHTMRVEVPGGSSFESRARAVRLAALEDASSDADWIVTGHHADDSAETAVTNLLRGAGATGLSGIAPRRGRWVRPLIGVPVSLVRATAVELGLPFFDDPANSDLRHRRNVIRSEVLPWLEERLEVPVVSVIGRSAGLLAADDAELERLAEAVPIRPNCGGVSAGAAMLEVLPGPIASRAARRLLRAAHPPYPGTAADVEAVLAVAAGDASRLGLTGGYFAVSEGPLVVVFDKAPQPTERTVLRLGESVDRGWWRISLGEPAGLPRVLVGRSRVAASAAALDGEMIVRSAEEGERLEIESGTKNVREVMREAEIPERLRSAWPIVAVDGKIAWVAGARLAGWARIGPTGGQVVVLAIEGTGV